MAQQLAPEGKLDALAPDMAKCGVQSTSEAKHGNALAIWLLLGRCRLPGLKTIVQYLCCFAA
jgi:hypothetical protein